MANFYGRIVVSMKRSPQAVAVELQRQADGAESPPPKSCTYGELRRLSEGVAVELASRGVVAGARCAILAHNGPSWLCAYLGAIASGAVAVPLDTNFSAEQVKKLVKDSASSLLFVDTKNLATAKRAVEGLPVGLFELESIKADETGDFIAAEAAEGDTAVILYTSGTTSDPKGVMLTHGNLAAEMDAAMRIVTVGPRDAILGVLPLFHALAQMANLLLPLAAGARVIFLESLNTGEIMRALETRGITLFVCVPQFFYLIHERVFGAVAAHGRLSRAAFRALLGLSALGRRLGLNFGNVLFRPVHKGMGPRMRYLCTGGSRMDTQVCRDFGSLGFDLLQAYGLTETTGAVFATPPRRNVPGSVGLPMRGVKLKLLDPKPLEEAGGRIAGEIAISGPMVMKGYYNRPEATAAVLRDGWLSTGDLGYLDDAGNLFICGRIKEMIVLSSGKNIYPEEIEAHYQQSPFIKEACVLGLRSKPGEPFSERLHGVIVPNFDVLRERRIVNAREAIRFDLESLSARLPAAKRILSYDLWQEPLPRTTTRKIKRFEVERRVRALKEAAQAGGVPAAAPRALTPEDLEWLSQPGVARAIAVIKASAKNEGRDIHPRDNIELDLGLDSMERVELLAALQNELGSRVEDPASLQVFTVRELVDVVRAHAGAAGAARSKLAWEGLLNAGSPGPEAADIIRPRPVADRLWRLFFGIVNLLARWFYGLRVDGLEKLPKKGPFILCPNHQSYLDGPILISALSFSQRRRLFYVGTSEIFGAGLALRVGRSLRLIPIDPDANLVQAMRAGAFGLSQGRSLVLFPEGERSIDGSPKIFKKGAAILSAHLKVPIVPVALEGFFDAWPRGGRLKLSGKLRIAFGDPIMPPETVEPGGAEGLYARMTAALRERLVAMWSALRQAP